MLFNSTTDWHSYKVDLENKIKLNVQLKTIGQLEEDAKNFTNYKGQLETIRINT